MGILTAAKSQLAQLRSDRQQRELDRTLDAPDPRRHPWYLAFATGKNTEPGDRVAVKGPDGHWTAGTAKVAGDGAYMQVLLDDGEWVINNGGPSDVPVRHLPLMLDPLDAELRVAAKTEAVEAAKERAAQEVISQKELAEWEAWYDRTHENGGTCGSGLCDNADCLAEAFEAQMEERYEEEMQPFTASGRLASSDPEIIEYVRDEIEASAHDRLDSLAADVDGEIDQIEWNNGGRQVAALEADFERGRGGPGWEL